MRSLTLILIVLFSTSGSAHAFFQSDTVQIQNLIDQGKVLVYENPDSAQSLFQQALRLAEGSGSNKYHASSRNWIGVAYYILGEYNAALPYFTHALRLSEDINDHRGMATSLNHIGLIYHMQGQYEQAIKQHEKALVHAERAAALPLRAPPVAILRSR